MNLANTYHFINRFQLVQVANNFVVSNPNNPNFIIKKIQISLKSGISSKIMVQDHVAELQTPLARVQDHVAELQTPLAPFIFHTLYFIIHHSYFII
jgi:hypothetical protein